jgi:hypothetical protein
MIVMADQENKALIRIGGVGAILAALTFLFMLFYLFGILGLFGMTDEMLDNPALLLQWIAVRPGMYTSLNWIFLLTMVFLFPVPLAVYERLKLEGPALALIGAIAGTAGVVLGILGPLLTAATAPILARAYVAQARSDQATLALLSELFGEIGLYLRLISDVFLAAWLGLNGIIILRRIGLKSWLGWFCVGLADFIVFVAVAKVLALFDLEPLLGLMLAIAYLWLGLWLLRFSPLQVAHWLTPARRAQ